MATTQFELVTPTRTLYSGHAEMIVCRTVNGEIAFLANHMPYIGALDTGLVRIVGPVAGEDGPTGPDVRLAVNGGFVEVKDNQVIMLADEAVLADEIDGPAAQRDLDAAGNAGDEAEVEAAEKWARARLEAVG